MFVMKKWDKVNKKNNQSFKKMFKIICSLTVFCAFTFFIQSNSHKTFIEERNNYSLRNKYLRTQ